MEEKISRYLSVGNACDLKCVFCYNDKNKQEEIFFDDYNVLIKRINDLAKERKHIVIIGGEPLIYPKILNLLLYIKLKKIKSVALITNGVKFCDEKFLKMFLKINTITFLKISINSHTKSLEKIISGNNGNSFIKRENGIKNLQKLILLNTQKFKNLTLASNTVITKYNYKYLNEIVFYIYNLGIKTIAISFIYNLRGFSKINLDSTVSYSEVINIINTIKLKNDINFRIDWLPYCLHKKIKIGNYGIREVIDYYDETGKSNKVDYKKQYKVKLKKCETCKAYGKYCNGVFKFYLDKYGDKEFL